MPQASDGIQGVDSDCAAIVIVVTGVTRSSASSIALEYGTWTDRGRMIFTRRCARGCSAADKESHCGFRILGSQQTYAPDQ